MKTIVYQSYRTNNVPDWIKTCMQTVKAWADSNQFDYQTFDDSFFEYVPEWFRNKTNNEICPITDLARLIVAKQFLSEGYERAIWIDADMLVFEPEKLVVNIERDFLFCHEIWLLKDAANALHVSHRVNNSFTVFCRNNVHLDFFIDACLRIGKQKITIGKLDIGTNFLSKLRNILPFPLMENVGILSPALMREIVLEEPLGIIEYAQNLISPIACGNLCASLKGRDIQGVIADDSLYTNVINALLSTRGDIINGLRQPELLCDS